MLLKGLKTLLKKLQLTLYNSNSHGGIGNRSSYREVRVIGSRYREKILNGTRKMVRIKEMFE